MKKIIAITVILLANILLAQEDFTQKDSLNFEKRTDKKHSRHSSSFGGFGGFMIGGAQIDLDNLNKSLKNNGYKEFDNLVLTTGGGGFGVINNLLIGGEGHGVKGLAESGTAVAGTQRYKMTLKMNYGMFDLGYLFYSSKNFSSFVMGGIGHNEIEFRITEDKPEMFNDLLVNPKRDLILNKETYLVDFSVGGNYMYNFGAIMFLGIKAGYVFAFDQDSNENNILDCPSFGVTGPYAKVFIGFGGGAF